MGNGRRIPVRLLLPDGWKAGRHSRPRYPAATRPASIFGVSRAISLPLPEPQRRPVLIQRHLRDRQEPRREDRFTTGVTQGDDRGIAPGLFKLPQRLAVAGLIGFTWSMLRQRLIWMALGAGCSAAVAIVVQLQRAEPVPGKQWYLKVAERSGTDHGTSHPPVWLGAKIASECGVRAFEMVPSFNPDGVDSTRIPLLEKNESPIFCVIQRSRDAGLWIGVAVEPIHLI